MTVKSIHWTITKFILIILQHNNITTLDIKGEMQKKGRHKHDLKRPVLQPLQQLVSPTF